VPVKGTLFPKPGFAFRPRRLFVEVRGHFIRVTCPLGKQRRIAYNPIVGRRAFTSRQTLGSFSARSSPQGAPSAAQAFIDRPMGYVELAPDFLGTLADMEETKDLLLGLGQVRAIVFHDNNMLNGDGNSSTYLDQRGFVTAKSWSVSDQLHLGTRSQKDDLLEMDETTQLIIVATEAAAGEIRAQMTDALNRLDMINFGLAGAKLSMAIDALDEQLSALSKAARVTELA